jgi:hypothetical protein
LGGSLTRQFRRYLKSRGLSDWQIYFAHGRDLGDPTELLEQIGEDVGRWEPHAKLPNGGGQPDALLRGGHRDEDVIFPAGYLWLRKHQVIIGRWHYFEKRQHNWLPLVLYAASTTAHHTTLRQKLSRMRRRESRNVWHIIGGQPWNEQQVHRDGTDTWDSLVLDDALRQRLEAEIGGFFTEPVKKLYTDLKVPYRRGLLLYGPPGNGKTSLVRVAGSQNPQIPGLILRAGDGFDDDQLAAVLDRWRDLAPAILVIEDLDWLLRASQVNVSTFLNALDGVDRHGQGLLLIATTNHPESLDPAINQRPGRFDVAIEVPPPKRGLRVAFFRRSCVKDLGDVVIERLADRTDGLSFAHLREIVSLSGLNALHHGHVKREPQDIWEAAELVCRGFEEAQDGFPQPSQPFGLQQLRQRS